MRINKNKKETNKIILNLICKKKNYSVRFCLKNMENRCKLFVNS